MATPNPVDVVTGVQASGSTTYTVTLPTYSEGDVLYIALARDGAGTLTLAGWTELHDDIPIGAPSAVFNMWYKTASASETNPVTVSSGLSERAVWVAWSVSGDDGINAEAADGSGTGTTATYGAVTSTVDECLRISIVATDLVTDPITAPTGHNTLGVISVTSGATVGVYYQALLTAGVSSAPTSTLNASEEWITVSFAIAPGGFTPPVVPSTPAGEATAAQRIRTYLPA